MGTLNKVTVSSIYVHAPFCSRRCFYCDFAVVPLGDKASGANGPGSRAIKSYLNLLHREIAVVPDGPPLATVYIGGGTPSLLAPAQISSLLKHLENRFLLGSVQVVEFHLQAPS